MTDHTHLWGLPEPVRFSIGLPRVEFFWQGPYECTCGVSAWLVDGRNSATWSIEPHRTETKTWPCMYWPHVYERHTEGPCTLARRYRPERKAWADQFRDDVDGRPYLVAHPEREIAVVRWRISRSPFARCLACNINTGIGLTEYGAEGWAERHNLAVHPRRFARQNGAM